MLEEKRGNHPEGFISSNRRWYKFLNTCYREFGQLLLIFFEDRKKKGDVVMSLFFFLFVCFHLKTIVIVSDLEPIGKLLVFDTVSFSLFVKTLLRSSGISLVYLLSRISCEKYRMCLILRRFFTFFTACFFFLSLNILFLFLYLFYPISDSYDILKLLLSNKKNIYIRFCYLPSFRYAMKIW